MEVLTPSDYQFGRRKRPKRSLRPCDACRKRKTRCIAGKERDGKCVHCELRGSACTFQQKPPDRLPQSDTTPTRNGQSAPLVQLVERASAQGDMSPEQPRRTTGDCQGPARTGSDVQPEHESPASAVSDFTPDASTLGLAHSRFAELYGLGSDMEPILMVGDVPSASLETECS